MDGADLELEPSRLEEGCERGTCELLPDLSLADLDSRLVVALLRLNVPADQEVGRQDDLACDVPEGDLTRVEEECKPLSIAA